MRPAGAATLCRSTARIHARSTVAVAPCCTRAAPIRPKCKSCPITSLARTFGSLRVFGRDAGFTALYTAYTTSIRCVVPEYRVNLDKLIGLLVEEKRANPSNYALVVLSEGAEWEGYQVREYGEPDSYGHRKKASVADSLADEIKRRTGEETMTSDLTYDLRSGDPDFVDKLVGVTFGNMAYDPML